MTEVPQKSRARTSRLTWAVAVVFLIAGVAGGIWAYFNLGPGRTVDTSGINPGMKYAEVEEILGKPDEVVQSSDGSAWRYGQTHIWFVGVPGMGSVVTEVSNGPDKPEGEPKAKRPRGFGRPKSGNKGKGPPNPEQSKPADPEKKPD